MICLLVGPALPILDHSWNLESWVKRSQPKTESTEVGQSDISRNISNDSHKFMVDSSFLRTIKTKGDRSHEIAICSDSFDITALLIS